MNFQILSTEYYLPEGVITNAFLKDSCGADPEFLEKKIGIRERRISRPDEPTSEMAYRAAKKLFENNSVDPDTIDLVIVCTQNPDYKLPTTACLVHEKLKLRKNCPAFDINLGCSGFLYSALTAGSYIQAGHAKNALIIMADEYSKIIDYHDKATATLFGDAASASLLTACRDGAGFVDFENGTDGSGAMNLVAFNSGVVKQPDKPAALFMNGREVFKFAISVVPDSCAKILDRRYLRVDQIKYCVFHQANAYMLGEIKKKMGLTDEQMVIDMDKYGNTVSSTIPIAFKNLLDGKKLAPGDNVLFCGFGVGLSWSTALYVMP